MADPSTTAQSTAARPTNQPDPLLGRVINDRFKVLSILARGGMGKVYRAEQSPLGRVCALKVLNPNYQGENDPEFHKRFFLEASTAAKLHHPNTVTVYDYGQTTDGIYFMAMELLEGRTLHRLIREESPLDPGRVLHILLQTCRSLREAHGFGVIHRDLKPANIFLIRHDDDPDYVKVLDFGLVKNVDEANPAENLTQTGLFMGSPKYMAPEQIRGEKVSTATDVYALGVMLYEMLTGKVPFDRPNSVNVLMAHVSEPVPPMGTVNPTAQIPAVLEEITYRCLSKRPDERYASMDEFIAALKQAGMAIGAGVPGIHGTGEFGHSLAPVRVTSSGENPIGAPREPTPSASRVATVPPGGLPSQLPPILPPSLPPSPAWPSAPPITADAPPLAILTSSELAQHFDPEPNPPPQRGLLVAIGLVVFILAVGVGLAIHSATTPRPHAPSPTVPVVPVTASPTAPPVSPPTQGVSVAIDSTPPGAEVTEHGQVIGHTPLHEAWTGERGDPAVAHTFTLHLQGFQDATVTLQGAALTRTVELQPSGDQAPVHPTAPGHPPGSVVRHPRTTPHGTVPTGYRRDPYGDEN